MPVKVLPDDPPTGNFRPITPDGFTPIPNATRENMVDVTGRAVLNLMPGSQGPGGPSLGDELKGELRKVGASAETHLATMISLMDIIGKKAAGAQNPNPTFGGAPMMPNPPVDPQAVAQGMLSKQAGRAALETGAGIVATLPFGAEGGFVPALTRMGAGAVGGALGSLASESFDPTKSPALSAGGAALTQGAGQAVGEFITGVLGGTKLEAGGARAYNDITSRGGVIPPGNISRSGLVDFAQNISSKSIGGGGIMEAARYKAENIATNMVDEFVSNYTKGATKADTGELLINAVKQSHAYFDQVMDQGFRAADQVVGKAAVDIRPMKQLAASIAQDATKEVGSAGKAKLAADILQRPDSISFNDAQLLRKSLRQLSPGAEDLTTRGGVEAAGERMSGSLSASMDDAAKSTLSPDGYRYWKGFNQAYAEGAEKFNGRVVSAIAKRDPEAFYNYGVKANNAFGIKELRGIVNNDQAWENIQGQIAKDLVARVTDASGHIDGKALSNSIKPGGSFGQERFVAAFDKEAHENLQHIARTLQLTQDAGSKSAPGGMAIQIMQGTQLMGGAWLFSANKAGTAAAILVAPAMIAKMLTTKPVVHALTVGLMTRTGTKATTNAFMHFAAQLAKHKLVGGPLSQIVPQPVTTEPGQSMSLPPGTVTPIE